VNQREWVLRKMLRRIFRPKGKEKTRGSIKCKTSPRSFIIIILCYLYLTQKNQAGRDVRNEICRIGDMQRKNVGGNTEERRLLGR
jgi:hypothetical protein